LFLYYQKKLMYQLTQKTLINQMNLKYLLYLKLLKNPHYPLNYSMLNSHLYLLYLKLRMILRLRNYHY
jgi:hypothetical protein